MGKLKRVWNKVRGTERGFVIESWSDAVVLIVLFVALIGLLEVMMLCLIVF
jgi:hypothetical protein